MSLQPAGSKTPRLAELLAALSLGTDLGMGQPMEHVLRQCLIALRLGERIGLSESERGVAYYVSLVAWVGCHIDAYEQAKWFGDDLVLKHDFRHTDMSGTATASMFMLKHLGHGRPLPERARLSVGFMSDGRKAAAAILENHWLAADDLAEQLGLGPEVRRGIEQTFERWDGKGIPKGAAGQDITPTARLVNLADVVEVYQRAAGVDAAIAVARERSGTQFDPDLVTVFCAEAPMLFADLDSTQSWDAVIAAEPALEVELTDEGFDAALEAIADFTDLKSPYTLGHSRAVADLAETGARSLGLPDGDATTVRRAGLVHDLGRLGVSNAVWDREGTLSPAEMERVRLHPYLTERMLASSPSLAPLGAIAAQHHERMDGSGYPRGISGGELSPSVRILGAADMYHARLEPRPHRPTRTRDEAASDVRAEVRSGRLDGDAVEAVLGAAGHRSRRRREGPAGLTAREIEVLRLVARGLSNKEIARQLVISPATARNHIEHIYAKIGVANRAQASLFATKHGLMDDVSASEPAV